MNNHAKSIDIVDVTAFLAVSCEHLELDSACLYRAAHRVCSPQVKQQLPIPPTETGSGTKSRDDYRRIARNLLVAVGMSAFLAGPALADPVCPGMGVSVTQRERHVMQMEQHHKQLHDALKLSSEQEPGWKKLLDSEQPKTAPSAAKTEDWSRLTAPERAAKMLELSKAHQEYMAEHVTSLTAFYDTLTTEQKKTFEDFQTGLRNSKHGKSRSRPPNPDKAPTTP